MENSAYQDVLSFMQMFPYLYASFDKWMTLSHRDENGKRRGTAKEVKAAKSELVEILTAVGADEAFQEWLRTIRAMSDEEVNLTSEKEDV